MRSKLSRDVDLDKAAEATAQRTNSTGIPASVLQHVEQSVGRDLSSVRVHPESTKAPALGALAYTQGNDVHVAPGHYRPNTPAGRRLLGHELTHVAQQAEGRVRPTKQIAGVPVNDDASLEQEADQLGAKAARANPPKVTGD